MTKSPSVCGGERQQVIDRHGGRRRKVRAHISRTHIEAKELTASAVMI